MAAAPLDLIDRAYAWTEARAVAATGVPLDAATPCRDFTLGELFEHLFAAVARFASAVRGTVVAPESLDTWRSAPDVEFQRLAADALDAWRQPGSFDGDYVIPLGTVPAPVAAHLNVLEVVVHGWDISQSTGERAIIPDDLAEPTLAFATDAINDSNRSLGFGPPLPAAGTPSDTLIAFLGRRPLPEA